MKIFLFIPAYFSYPKGMVLPVALKHFLRNALARANEAPGVRTSIRWPDGDSPPEEARRCHLESLALVGALMNRVAYADDELHPEEETTMRQALTTHGHLTAGETRLILAAARESSERQLDTYGFTRHLNDLPYEERQKVLHLLFVVAYADGSLSHVEMEAIRKIAGLLCLEHKDMIRIKLTVRDSRSK